MDEPMAAEEPFNAELYLRLLGERSLLDPPEPRTHPWESPLSDAAAALVAVAAIDAETADRVVADYELAKAVRGDQQTMHLHRMKRQMARAGAPTAPIVLEAPHIVVCESDVEVAQGSLRVHYVSFDERSTALTVTLTQSPAQARPIHVPGHVPFAGLHQIPITDDAGTTASSHLNGGGSPGGHWFGRLVTDSPLSRTTAWLAIGSARLNLPREATRPTVTVTVEDLLEASPAERYLRHRLARGRHMGMAVPTPGLDASVEALVEAGAVDADSDVVTEVRTVAASMGSQANVSSFSRSGLPVPWASVLGRRGASDGPEATVAIGAVTPPVDGTVMLVEGLQSTATAFQVEALFTPELSPTALHGMGDTQIVWWAEDDRGNHYLGGISGTGSGNGITRATVTFWPALDPQAHTLRLLPTGRLQRAVVTIDPLPWADSP